MIIVFECEFGGGFKTVQEVNGFAVQKRSLHSKKGPNSKPIWLKSETQFYKIHWLSKTTLKKVYILI